jgi:hypothetical protein
MVAFTVYAAPGVAQMVGGPRSRGQTPAGRRTQPHSACSQDETEGRQTSANDAAVRDFVPMSLGAIPTHEQSLLALQEVTTKSPAGPGALSTGALSRSLDRIWVIFAGLFAADPFSPRRP